MKAPTIGLAALVLLAGFSIIPGQELIRTIYLPDSNSGVLAPLMLAYNPVNEMVYVGAMVGKATLAFDPLTHRSVARIRSGDYCNALCVNTRNNKVYSASGVDRSVSVLSGTSHTRLAEIETDGEPLSLGYNPAANKVYIHGCEDNCLTVVDGDTDRKLAELAIGEPPFDVDRRTIICDSVSNRVFCPMDGSECVPYLVVVDGASDQVVDSVRLVGEYFYSMCLDTAGRTIYCATDGENGCVVNAVDVDSSVVLWSRELEGAYGPILTVSYSPTMGRLYLLDEEEGIFVLDVTTREVVEILQIRDLATDMYLVEDVGLLFCADDWGVVTVYDVRDNSWVKDIEVSDGPSRLCYSPASRRLYLIHEMEQLITLLDVDNASVFLTRSIGRHTVGSTVDARGTRLYCPDRDGSCISVIDLASLVPLDPLPVARWPHLTCYNPNSDKVYSVHVWTDTLSIVYCDDGELGPRLNLYMRTAAMVYGETADALFCASEGMTVAIDGSTDSEVGRSHAWGTILCRNESLDKLYCAHPGRNGVSVIWGRCDSSRDIHRVGWGAGDLCLNPRLNRVYMTVTEGRVCVIDCSTDQVVSNIEVEHGPGALCLDSTYSLLFCGHDDGTVSVIDCITEQVIATVQTPAPILDISYNAASNRVYCTHEYDGVTVFDADTRELRGTLQLPGRTYRSSTLCDPLANRVYIASNYCGMVVIQDGPPTRVAISETGPTLVGRTVTLLGTSPACLLDITGRRICDLAPGRNELSTIPTGVYFIRRESDDLTQKVIVQR